MVESKDARGKDLVTQRDIDNEFGLFTDEMPEGTIPAAEEELLAAYPYDEVLGPDEDRVAEAEASTENSPVDPAAPKEHFHGTDLINGVGREPEKENRKR